MLYLNSGGALGAAVIDSDGSQYRFGTSNSGSTFHANKKYYGTGLVHISSPTAAYEYTAPDGRVDHFEKETFDVLGGGTTGSPATEDRWVMTQSTYRSGLVVAYTRDDYGRITEISDDRGRAITLSWDGEAVSEIDAPGDVQIDYAYERQEIDTGSGMADVPGTALLVTVDVHSASKSSGQITTYHYDDTNYRYLLTSITDARDVTYAEWEHDGFGRVTQSKHADDQDITTFAYSDTVNGSGYYTRTVTNALGKEAIYSYQYPAGDDREKFRLRRVDGVASTNCPASVATQTFDSNNLLATRVDRNGHTTSFTYDTNGLPTEITEADGTADERVIDVTWDTGLRLPTEIEQPNLTTDATYDTQGRLTELEQTDTTSFSTPYSTNGQTRTWAFTYTTAGLLETIDGPLSGSGDTVTYTYDSNGYLATYTNEVGHVTEVVSVNGRGQPTEIIDPNGKEYDLTYDEFGQLTSVTAQLGWGTRVTALEYDEVGDITKVTLPDDSYFEYTYDDVRRLTSVENEAGERVEYAYDDMGDLVSRNVRDTGSSIVETQAQTFDELGRVLAFVGADSQAWTRTYDGVGNVVSIEDPHSVVFGYAYDALNRLITLTDGDNNDATFTWTPNGEVASVTDQNGVETTYVRNGWGEVIQEESNDVGTIVYVRDARGLVTEKTDGRGIVSDYAYDDAGRLTAITYPSASGENVAYTYDDTAGGNEGVGQLTSVSDESGSSAFTYDVRDRLVSANVNVGAQNYTVAYDYDSADRMAEIVYPSGRIVTYWYDSAGRPSAIATQKTSSNSVVDLGSYIATKPFDGRFMGMTLVDDYRDWRYYNSDGNVASYGVTDNSSNDILSRDLGYNDNFNLNHVWDQLDSSKDETYWRNQAYRLQNTSGPWGDLDIFYDAGGNRSYTEHTVSSVTTTDVYSVASGSNRIDGIVTNSTPTRSLTYDDAGNVLTDTKSGVTTTYTYNHAGRMSALTMDSDDHGPYLYNGFGQLVSRQVTTGVSTSTIHMIYDQDGNLIAEADATTGDIVREYVWFDGRPIAVYDQVDTGSPVLYYVHVDHLERPIMMTDASGSIVWRAIYMPFGDVYSITGSASLNYRFPGQWFMLETGLAYNWHRWYDASLGRYTRPDPLGVLANLDPSTLPNSFNLSSDINRWAYARSSSLLNIDPTGLIRVRDWRDFFMRFSRGDGGGGGGIGGPARPNVCPPRPAGLPPEWIEEPTKKNGGMKWTNPNNSNESVRAMPGNPSSPFETSRAPYYRWHKGNSYLDKYGNPTGNPEESHIPAPEFKYPVSE